MPATDPPKPSAAEAPGASVLVVDDEQGVRDLLRTVLSRASFRVVTAASAEEALDAVPDPELSLAIVDINLPDSNGLQLCRRLRDEHAIEIIMMTGDGQTYSYEDAIRSGACDFILKPMNIRELVLRCERAIQVRHVREERDRGMRELEVLSTTDELTGLANARRFFDQLKAESVRAERYARALSLVLLDLDAFKALNDTHGHPEGDRALRLVGRVIRSSIRESDSAYRYGGEEFTVLLPETDLEAAVPVAHRLLEAIGSSGFQTSGGQPVRVTASIGVAERFAGEDARAFLERTDQAMYASKRGGRNRVTVDEARAGTAGAPNAPDTAAGWAHACSGGPS